MDHQNGSAQSRPTAAAGGFTPTARESIFSVQTPLFAISAFFLGIEFYIPEIDSR